MKHIKFSVNNWAHLYSLQQAVLHNNQLSGQTLTINGHVKNSAFLNHQDTAVNIQFIQLETTPDYPLKTLPDKVSGVPVLGSMCLSNKQLSTEIPVDKRVFEELRKNLMEYADIEGIHIVVALGLYYAKSLEILQLDYAMKGDA